MKDYDALQRLETLFDEGCFNESDALFKSAEDENVICGFGKVSGVDVSAFVMNGALDTLKCKKIKKAYELAEKTGCPVIGIYDCNGLSLKEGFSLMSDYGELVKYASRLSGVVPQLSVIDGACLGVAAVMANMADVVIATENSDFCIAPPSDIKVSESAENGVIDYVADSFENAAGAVGDIISLLPQNNLSPLPVFEFENTQAGIGIIGAVSDNMISVELKKEYARNVNTVLTTVNGKTAGFICFNGFSLCSSCAYKAQSFIKLCDAYNIPVITVADSKGIKGDNQAQSLIAVTKLTSAYASATCPKISLIVSESTAGAFVILTGKGSNADVTLSLDDAIVSPLNVESAVAFLWNERLAAGESREALEAEYKSTLASPEKAAEAGAIDGVFPYEDIKEAVSSALSMLSSKRETTIPRKHSVK